MNEQVGKFGQPTRTVLGDSGPAVAPAACVPGSSCTSMPASKPLSEAWCSYLTTSAHE